MSHFNTSKKCRTSFRYDSLIRMLLSLLPLPTASERADDTRHPTHHQSHTQSHVPHQFKKRKQLKIGTKQTKQMDNVRYDALSLPSTAARLLGSLQSKMKLVDIKKK